MNPLLHRRRSTCSIMLMLILFSVFLILPKLPTESLKRLPELIEIPFRRIGRTGKYGSRQNILPSGHALCGGDGFRSVGND